MKIYLLKQAALARAARAKFIGQKTTEVTGGQGLIVVVINGSGIIKDIRLHPMP